MKDSPEPTIYSTRRIAVVEGDRAAAEMLHTFFRLLDLEPSLIDPSGDVFATIGRLHPDVAMLDADLPNLRAVDLAANLRRDDPHLGLLFTSGTATGPIDGIEVVPKPRRFDDLLDVMDAVLNAAARAHAA